MIAGTFLLFSTNAMACCGEALVLEYDVGKMRTCKQANECSSRFDCTPTKDCRSVRNCQKRRDNTPCKRKLLFAWINDPACEAAKAAQNAAYRIELQQCEAQRSAERLDCERQKLSTKQSCEAKKAASKLQCEELNRKDVAGCEQLKNEEISKSAELSVSINQAILSIKKYESFLPVPPRLVMVFKMLNVYSAPIDVDRIRVVDTEDKKELFSLIPYELVDEMRYYNSIVLDKYVFIDSEVEYSTAQNEYQAWLFAIYMAETFKKHGVDGFSQIWTLENDKLLRNAEQFISAACREIDCNEG